MSSAVATNWAGQCDVVNKGKGDESAEIVVKGTPLLIAPKKFKLVPDCSIVVKSGKVQLRGLVGGIPAPPKICDAGTSCVLENTTSLVAPKGYTYEIGGRQMDKDVVRRYGMPHGEVYSLDTASQFDFSQVQGGATTFALFDAKSRKPIFEAPITNNRVVVPTDRLQRGMKYSWEVYGKAGRGRKLSSGVFNVMPDAEAEAVTKELTALDVDGSRSPVEKLFDELSVYYVHDLTYEIEVTKATLREQS